MKMFEQKKIETLQKKNEKLEGENALLRAQNKELHARVESMESIVRAAQDCIDANKKMSKEIGYAKTQYEAAIQELTLLKKDYKRKMDDILKSISV